MDRSNVGSRVQKSRVARSWCRSWCALAGTALTLLAAAAMGVEPEPDLESRPPNLLLISIDTLRADHTSLHGYARPTTPNLDALARAGTAFTLAYAPTAATAPTHATIFTGTPLPRHGLIQNGRPLDTQTRTLAERLHAQGYQTAAIVSSFVLDSRFRFDRGFSIYRDDFDPETASVITSSWEGHEVEQAFDQRANETTRRAIRWLWFERDASRPFFLFVHYFDPHAPYDPPEEYRRRFAPPAGAQAATPVASALTALRKREQISYYDAEIAFTDAEIGRLLDELERQKLVDDTLVVVTADHGEGLMDHGARTHSVDVYEESLRVPLVFRLPGVVEPGRRYAEPVELTDILPTLLSLLGLEGPGPDVDGRDLSSALRGQADLDPDHPVVVYRRHFEAGRVDGVEVEGSQLGIRVGDWKLIQHSVGDDHELYDLENDPGEGRNLHAERPDARAPLEAALEGWQQRYRESHPPVEISPEVKSALEALGYSE